MAERNYNVQKEYLFGIDINEISLTECTHLNRDIKRYRDLHNRIKVFKKQIYKYEDLKGITPSLAKLEVKRLQKIKSYYLNNYLINNNSKIKSIKKELNQLPTIKKHWQNVTKLDYLQNMTKLNLVQSTMLKTLEESSLKARRTQLVWRLRMALREAAYNGWYIIFNTLTVATEHYNTVWDSKQRSFTKYIYRLDKISGKKNHKYFAVTEQGSANNREHIHIIHLLKDIPDEWKKDPNKGVVPPVKRVIDAARPLWTYGFSSPIAVRYSAADAFSRLGWKWTVSMAEGPNYVPSPSGTTDRLAYYVSKYLTKTLEKGVSKQWKIKLTQGIGLTVLNKATEMMSKKELRILMSMQKTKNLSLLNKPIPTQLLKTAAHRKLIYLSKKDNSSTQLMTLEARPSIMKRLQILTQAINPFNSLSITSSSAKNLSDTEIFKIQEIINKAAIEILGTDKEEATSFQSTGVSKTR